MGAIDLSPGEPPTRAPSAGEAHLRVIDLRQAGRAEESLRLLLSADELERAARFHRPADRCRFVTTRGWLRVVLAGALGASPDRLAFAFGVRGKPRLAGAFADAGLAFNVSHSADHALIGLASGQAIGVDIEQVRPMSDFEHIAGGYFSAQETRAIIDAPLEDRLRVFFRCWTRKEAFMKATGEGMSMPLDGFSVSVGEQQDSTITVAESPGAPARSWSVRGVSSIPSCEAAVALEHSATRTSAWLDPVRA